MAKILVVDDDKDTCWLLSNILKEDGYQVEIAQTGKSALKRIKAIESDVMVLDYNLSRVRVLGDVVDYVAHGRFLKVPEQADEERTA